MDDKTRNEIKQLLQRCFLLGFECGCNVQSHDEAELKWGQMKYFFEADVDRIAALWPKQHSIQIPLHCLNKLQMDSIREMLKKAPQMHYADIIMRINGQDIKFQADWIKSMVMPQDKED